jgi:alpha-tubulin suppressor-like RCC1 family protein
MLTQSVAHEFVLQALKHTTTVNKLVEQNCGHPSRHLSLPNNASCNNKSLFTHPLLSNFQECLKFVALVNTKIANELNQVKKWWSCSTCLTQTHANDTSTDTKKSNRKNNRNYGSSHTKDIQSDTAIKIKTCWSMHSEISSRQENIPRERVSAKKRRKDAERRMKKFLKENGASCYKQRNSRRRNLKEEMDCIGHINLVAIRTCSELLFCLEVILRQIADNESNFYGTYRRSLYQSDLLNVSRALEFTGLYIYSDFDEAYYCSYISIPRSSSALMVTSSYLRCHLFWSKHFGNALYVWWPIFEEAFLQEYYGLHHSASSLKILCDLLISPYHHPHHGLGKVTKTRYQQFVSGELCLKNPYHQRKRHCDGLHDLYQVATDDRTSLIMFGLLCGEKNHDPLNYNIITISQSMNIKSFSCGGEHAAILTQSGLLFTWGKASFGRLGHGKVNPGLVEGHSSGSKDWISNVLEPQLVKYFVGDGKGGEKVTNIRQVACGFAYTACVTENNKMYTFGAGEYGTLGTGTTIDQWIPVKVNVGETKLLEIPVQTVVAGSVHTLALTVDGRVFSCGKKEYTGHGHISDVLVFTRLNAFDGRCIEQVSIGPGGYHTLALTVQQNCCVHGDYEKKYDEDCSNHRHIYSWGHNRVGQLGIENEKIFPVNYEGAYFLPKPIEIKYLQDSKKYEPIVKVVAGWSHSGMFSKNGKVYMCGRYCKGQISVNNSFHCKTNERGHCYVPIFSEINICTDDDDDNEGDDVIVDVSCGGEHTVLLSESGNFYSFGDNSEGQLGHNGRSVSTFTSPRIDSAKGLSVSCGNACTFLLVQRPQPMKLIDICKRVLSKMEKQRE